MAKISDCGSEDVGSSPTFSIKVLGEKMLKMEMADNWECDLCGEKFHKNQEAFYFESKTKVYPMSLFVCQDCLIKLEEEELSRQTSKEDFQYECYKDSLMS